MMSSALLLVIFAVLPALPKISPPNFVTELNDSSKTYGLVKLVPFGSTTSTPGPTKLLDVKLGASLRKVKVPALMVVAPVYVLFPLSVTVPVLPVLPIVNAPLPLTTPAITSVAPVPAEIVPPPAFNTIAGVVAGPLDEPLVAELVRVPLFKVMVALA